MTCLNLAQWHQYFRWEVGTTSEKNEFREQAERKRLGAKTCLKMQFTKIAQFWGSLQHIFINLVLDPHGWECFVYYYYCTSALLLFYWFTVVLYAHLEKRSTHKAEKIDLWISLKLDPDEHSHILRSVDTKKWTQKWICIRWTHVSTCKLVSWMLENGGLNMKGKI